MPRTNKEKIIDIFLTLYLLDDLYQQKNTSFIGKVKMQKLVFLSEKDMIDQREKGFNFDFIRLDYGPYSAELETDRKKLVAMGYLFNEKLTPTSEAQSLIQEFRGLIDRNSTIIAKIRENNSIYGGYSPFALKIMVHRMPWGAEGKTIHDLDLTTPMLYTLNPSKAKIKFEITKGELEDLSMNLEPEICRILESANNDMREGRLVTHEQVFSNL